MKLPRGLFCLLILVLSLLSFNCTEHYQQKANNIDTLRENIIGFWGGRGEGEDSAVWKISKDSIYYLQEKKAYRYKLFNDSIVIFFPDHSAALKDIKLDKDTLSWKSDIGGRNFGYRFPQKLKPIQ